MSDQGKTKNDDMWSKDVAHEIFHNLDDVRDAIRLSRTSKQMRRWWHAYLVARVQPFIGFRTSPQHLALILAEFQGMVGNRGVEYCHPISGRLWWVFSKTALDRMIAPKLRKYFTRITMDPRHHRIMECVGHHPMQYAAANTKHMIEAFRERFEEKREQARQQAEKQAINNARIHPSVGEWLARLGTTGHAALIILSMNPGRNKQFVKADIEHLHDTAIHGFFCAITDHLYGSGTASAVLVCRAVIKRHQHEFWQSLISGRSEHYDVNDGFVRELESAVADFKRRISERLVAVCTDARIAHLDAAQVLARHARDPQGIDAGVMRIVRRITRLKLIEVWDVIRYHMYARSLSLKARRQLVDFVSKCFPHRIETLARCEDVIPRDRACIYSALEADLALVFDARVDFIHGEGAASPEQDWFVQEYRHVNVARLAREIDWPTTVHSFFRMGHRCSIVAARHAVLRRIWKLQQQQKKLVAPPTLWLPTNEEFLMVANEVDRAAKRARLIES